MNMSISRIVVRMTLVAAAALAIGRAGGALAGEARTVMPPVSFLNARYFEAHPDAWRQLLAQLPHRSDETVPHMSNPPTAAGGMWYAVTQAPTSGLCNPLLLTDGAVMVHNCDTPDWYKLTPDNAGNYASGTWSQLASLPVIGGTQYAPQYFSSAVLPDGRVIVMGGEYNGSGSAVRTNLGAIYDPVANTWTPVAAPAGSGWSEIGDAQGLVLANGTFMLGSCCGDPDVDALFNPATLSWTATGAPSAGDGYQDEQGYDLLPSGKVLTVDVWTNYPNYTATNTELYDPAGGTWGPSGNTPATLADPCGSAELGPAALRGDGTVVAFGGNTGCNGVTADPIAIYKASKGTWIAGPSAPAACGKNSATSCTLADAPAAVMPNGKILFAASAGEFKAPTHFFEFGRTNTIAEVTDPVANAGGSSSYFYNLLVLPNGQVLMTDFSGTAEVYQPSGSALAAYGPTITRAPSTVGQGKSYLIEGTQLNGVTQGAYYGDDAQGATNYPIVRITNTATGHVAYGRTMGFSTMSLKRNTAGAAHFTLPASIESGASTLSVIANGIASPTVSVTVN